MNKLHQLLLIDMGLHGILVWGGRGGMNVKALEAGFSRRPGQKSNKKTIERNGA